MTTQPSQPTHQYKIDGMSCQSCATRLEKVLNKKESVAEAVVNFATESLSITYHPNQNVDEALLAQWVSQAGFTLTPPSSTLSTDLHTPEKASIQFIKKHWLLLVLSLPFFVGMIGMMLGFHQLMPPVWLQFILASIVQFWVARSFYQGAWASIKGRLANMDVLVVVGTLAIWAYSSYVFWTYGIHAGHGNHHVYFEAGVMVITFMTLGKFLEHRAKREGLDSISMLLSLTPNYVQVKTSYGFSTVTTSQVKPNQIVLAKQYDRIGLDGIVVSGMGYCDESHLTGESALITKKAGDKVLAGAMVSAGSFEYKVTSDSQNTHLKQMIDDLAKAQGSKARIARIADKVAGVFVPVVIAISILTFALNLWLTNTLDTALMRAVAVLVIACPCALGLATPTAIMAGMGVAARHGVWFKDAKSLELSGKIDTVVFDKTGTLTQGIPKLVGESTLDGKQSTNGLFAVLASLEAYANHPLASVLVAEAQKRKLTLQPVQNPQIIAGSGIMGFIEGVGTVKVGKPEFVGYPLSAIPSEGIWAIASLVAMSIDETPVAIFALADDIKKDSQTLIQRWQHEGVHLVMMSGDKTSVVAHTASSLSLEQAFGELSPQDKANKIKELQDAGHNVVMIGDGINDALAMSVANTSFAVANATDIAKHTSAAVLMGDSLLGAYYAKLIAKRTVTTIYQNLFFAFIYNIIGIPLAAIGLLSPMVAAIAMTLSSISVIANASRLKRLNFVIKRT